MNRSVRHAKAAVTVHRNEAANLDSGGPQLVAITIEETFSGDFAGDSTAHALQVRNHDNSAFQVSMQRFCGSLDGRQGTFVLQGTGTVASGKVKAQWDIVPGSATGELRGLRGEGGFEGEFGKGSTATLDYWFE